MIPDAEVGVLSESAKDDAVMRGQIERRARPPFPLQQIRRRGHGHSAGEADAPRLIRAVLQLTDPERGIDAISARSINRSVII